MSDFQSTLSEKDAMVDTFESQKVMQAVAVKSGGGRQVVHNENMSEERSNENTKKT